MSSLSLCLAAQEQSKFNVDTRQTYPSPPGLSASSNIMWNDDEDNNPYDDHRQTADDTIHHEGRKDLIITWLLFHLLLLNLLTLISM